MQPRRTFLLRTVLVLLIASWLICRSGNGQESPQTAPKPGEPASEPVVTSDQIAQGLEAVEKAESLDDATRANLKALYEKAASDLQQATSWQEKLKEHEERIRTAPADVQRLRESLEAPLPPLDIDAAKREDLAALSAKLADLERGLEQARKDLSTAEGEPQRRTARRAEIPAVLSEKRKALEDARGRLSAAAPGDETPLARDARLAALRAGEAALAAEVAALELETKLYDAQTELPRLERDRLARQVGRLEEDIKTLRPLVDDKRKRDAASQKIQAQADLAAAPESLKAIAEHALDFAKSRLELATDINRLATEVDQVESDLAFWTDDFERTEERAKGQASSTLGLYLQKKRSSLPSVAPLRAKLSDREAEFRRVQVGLFELEDARSEHADIDRAVETTVARIDAGLDEEETEELEELVRALLTREARVLGDLLDDTNRYFDLLIRANTSQELLIEKIRQYEVFINARVFWVQSAPLPTIEDLGHTREALAWLVLPKNWEDVAAGLSSGVLLRFGPTALVALLLGALILFRGRAKGRIRRLGEVARRGPCQEFGPTLETLVLSLLLALPGPLLAWFVGWRLGDSPESFPLALSAAMTTVSIPLFALLTAKEVFRADGLAEDHFGWSRPVMILARRTIRRLLWLGLPPLFLTVLLRAQETDTYHFSLGRLVFVVAMVVVSMVTLRLLNRRRGVVAALRSQQTDHWAIRGYSLWYPLATFTPLVLALLAALGYYYTARVLAAKFFHTAGLILGLIFTAAVLYRWVRVKRRRLSIQKRQLEKQALQKEEPAAEPTGEPTTAFETPEAEVDLGSIDQQTRHLIRAMLFFAGLLGVWLIWVDVLPILSPLREAGLWPTTAPDGSEVWISVADVLFAIVVALVTYAAARNVPGLVEIVLLERLPLESSLRYAFTKLSQYAIVVVGILVTFTSLGLTWSKVQWLVAALGVGIGFGLQETVANFICGIILLFERPIRIGDIVTLGETTGVVTRIQIRATTIRNWDRKELVVPNKDLITGQILNWSLTDQTNRIVIPVGIAYGSDTRRARGILEEIIRSHPNVLETPAPLVTFEEFGASSLNFFLRAFLQNLDVRLETIHDLHTLIHDRFAEAGIEIAFPQQDLHIRTLPKGMTLTSGPDEAEHGGERRK